MFLKKLLCFFACASLLIASLASCSGQATNKPKAQAKAYYEFFDTKSIIYSYRGDSKSEFEANCADVAELLEEYHKLFDIYYEHSGVNNLKTINKNAGVNPVKVDEKLIDFLLYAKEIYTLTDGETNVAMGSVLKIWHDCREKALDDKATEAPSLPDSQELMLASQHCNIDDIIINREDCTVYLQDPEMSLDVGAVGKGYATEKAAKMLIEKGVSSYVLNIGGNIRAIGSKTTGEGWITGITNPDKNSDEPFALKTVIQNTSVVTSGDYERYFTVDEVNYHHIIDPDTLMPAEYFSSVSILTADSALADVLSTALFCISQEEGLALIQSIGEVEAIWIYKDGTVKYTDGIIVSE